MNLRTIIVALVIGIFTTASHTQPSEMAGVGTASCKDYLSFTTESDKLILLSWIQGFMTGLNLARSDLPPDRGTRQIPDSDVLQALVAAYCRRNSNDLLGTASTKVFFSLLPAKRPH